MALPLENRPRLAAVVGWALTTLLWVVGILTWSAGST